MFELLVLALVIGAGAYAIVARRRSRMIEGDAVVRDEARADDRSGPVRADAEVAQGGAGAVQPYRAPVRKLIFPTGAQSSLSVDLRSTLPRLRESAWLLLALALATWAQSHLVEAGSTFQAMLVYVVAVVIFLRIISRGGSHEITPAPTQVPLPEVAEAPPGLGAAAEAPHRGLQPFRAGRSTSRVLAGAVAVLALIAWVSMGGNRFTAFNVTVWIAAIAVFLAAAWERSPSPGESSSWAAGLKERFVGLFHPTTWTLTLSPTWIALIAIFLVAAFFRLYELDQVPAEMVSDHAEKLQDVTDVLNGQFSIFFPRNTGREAIQFYLTAAVIKIFGVPVDHLALKIGTAVISLFTIPWIYLLGKELYNRDVGLVAMGLTAVSQWHIVITRVGLRFPLTPAFSAPTLYFLVRAFKYNRRNDWLLCGLFLGLGLHGYTPFRAVAALVVALVLLKFALDVASARLRRPPAGTDRVVGSLIETTSLTRRFWSNATLGGVMAALVFLPLGRFMVDRPDITWFRALSRVSDVERQIAANPLLVFVDNIRNALLMFNYRGDVVWLSTVSLSPVLDTITAVLFVLGSAYVLWRLARHHDRLTIYFLVMIFFLLLPSTSSIAFPGENPGIARTGGAIPIVFIIAALPVVLILRRLFDSATAFWPRLAPYRVAATASGVALLLFSIAPLTYNWYFNLYDKQFRAAAWNTSEMGLAVRGFATSLGDMSHAYHVPYPHWADTRNIGIKAGDPTWSNDLILDSPTGRERLRQQAADPASKLYLVNLQDQNDLALLRETYPEGRTKTYRSATVGKDFLIFFVPAAR